MNQNRVRIRIAVIGIMCAVAVATLAVPMLPSFAAKDTASPVMSGEPGSGNLESYIEVLRSDLRTQKSALITENMNFSEKEAAAFWPIYRKYEAELMKLNDQKVALIKNYADNFDTMSDAKAKELAEKALSQEDKRVQLKKKYLKEFSKALPAKTVLRFFQVDNRIDLLINVQIAAELPMVEK